MAVLPFWTIFQREDFHESFSVLSPNQLPRGPAAVGRPDLCAKLRGVPFVRVDGDAGNDPPGVWNKLAPNDRRICMVTVPAKSIRQNAGIWESRAPRRASYQKFG
ncbi:hypothetical protein KM043_014970 [Ampulex compressa]|nr:hypothetical protein KM043_014970 [Ampulex compressa]